MIRLRIQFLKEATPDKDTSREDVLATSLENYFARHLVAGDFINWLALDGGAIVATGGICFHAYPPNFSSLGAERAYIMNIFTVPGYRNRGLGARIFEKLMDEAARRGVSMVSLHATDMGRKMYEKFGFEAGESEMMVILK